MAAIAVTKVGEVRASQQCGLEQRGLCLGLGGLESRAVSARLTPKLDPAVVDGVHGRGRLS